MPQQLLDEAERTALGAALRRNVDEGAAILMDCRTTGFLGTSDAVSDDEVIAAIKSVPCHY